MAILSGIGDRRVLCLLILVYALQSNLKGMLQLKASMEQIQMTAIDQAQFLAGQKPEQPPPTTTTTTTATTNKKTPTKLVFTTQ